MVNESVLDKSLLYFHGSMSKRKNHLDKPSYRYPFYITADLHYAMAFANKNYSSSAGGRKIEYGDRGYVYPITVNEKAEFFDFRLIAGDTRERHIMEKILTAGLFDFICAEWRAAYRQSGMPSDIWKFGQALAFILIDTLELTETGSLPELTDKHCDNYPDLIRLNMPELLRLTGFIREGTSHEALEYIFKRLDRLGYSGVITAEDDINDETGDMVSTDYAVGIWDITGFGIMYGAALEYGFCKRVYPEFVRNGKITEPAERKIRRFIEIYGRMFPSSRRK